MEDLDLNTIFKLDGVAPLKLTGYCKNYAGFYKEHHFTILEVDGGYQLTGPDGSEESFLTLKEAMHQCYLNWGG